MASFKIVNGRRAEQNIRSLSRMMKNMEPAFETVGGRFRSQVEAQFALGGALPGIRSTWAPLSPFTRSQRDGNRVLIDRSLLLQSYTDTRAVGNISDTHYNRARFGTGFKTRSQKGKLVPVAKFHQEGTIHMPARPVVLGNRFLDEDICDAFVDHIFRMWR